MRQLMNMGLKNALILGCLILGVSCGNKVNPGSRSAFSVNEISYMLIEKECAARQIPLSPVAVEISKMYNEYQSLYPSSFFFIPTRLYDYKSPLIISLKELEDSLFKLKHTNKAPGEIAEELYYLYQSSLRFEGQKCSLSQLVKKKNHELRPFLEMRDFCQAKNDDGICTAGTIEKLQASELSFVEERTVKMCRSFDSRAANCEVEYLLQKRKKTLGSLVAHYQKRFQQERFQKLFKLRTPHLSFACQKQDDVTYMTVKVSGLGWDMPKLNSLLEHVGTTWSRGNFRLVIEIVEVQGSDVIEIRPISGGISYVPDNENRLVYLSQTIDFNTQKKVLAHEFGHVLGFPDCYTEFFDNQKKELVYYELSNDNTNIMCSLKNGVSVPDDYFQQLAQKSCLFY